MDGHHVIFKLELKVLFTVLYYLVHLGSFVKALGTVHWAKSINSFCALDLYDGKGMCHYWLKDYKETINSFKKIKTSNRNNLFYLTASL